jgi:hypothetical protein
MKRTIRLTESELKQVIKESVTKILSEADGKDSRFHWSGLKRAAKTGAGNFIGYLTSKDGREITNKEIELEKTRPQRMAQQRAEMARQQAELERNNSNYEAQKRMDAAYAKGSYGQRPWENRHQPNPGMVRAQTEWRAGLQDLRNSNLDI